MLVSLDMHLVVLELLPFSLQLAQFALVLLANETLLLSQGRLKLGCVFNCRAAFEHLRLECTNLRLESHLSLLFFLELY